MDHGKSGKENQDRSNPACGCGTTPDANGRKATGVDAEIKGANIRRLRRIEGQVRGIQKMVEEDRYCPDIMMQLSAIQEALRTVGRELLRNHLKHCTTQAVAHGSPGQADTMFDELIELIYRHSR